jgi:hypothetical protein
MEEVLALADAICKDRDANPTIVEIWFVDRPAEYHRFLDAFPETVTPRGFRWPHGRLFDIPVIDWRSEAEPDPETMTPAETAQRLERLSRAPRNGRMPGMWLKLPNGRFRRVAPGEFLAWTRSGNAG